MPGATKITFPGPLSPWRKNARRIVFYGEPCKGCGRGKIASIVAAKLPARLTAGLPVQPVDGPVMLSMIAYWPRQHRTSRAPGQPCGDADAIPSAVSDALIGRLYNDDAQVAVLVAASAYDKGNPRVEVMVAPLSAKVLEVLEVETGLGFTSATLSTGQQEPLGL